jgi:PAS domain S-box-containing protein
MSFRLKTILGVALIEAILLSILVWTGLDYMKRSAEREFTQRAAATVKAFTVTTKDAIIATDLATLKSLVDDILAYPGVLYARVRDADGNELATAGDRVLLGQRFSADRVVGATADQVFDTAADIEAGGTVFGRVELGLSTEALHSQLKQVRNFGVGLAILEMVLVALFSAVLGTYLTRQLDRLALASEHLARGEYGYQVPVHGKDELARTARTFNAMSVEVRDAYARLAERNENLRNVLENIQDGIITLDATGRITSFSPAAEAIFGITSERMLGLPLTRLVACDALAGTESSAEFARDRLGQLINVSGMRTNGGAFPLEIRVTDAGLEHDHGYIVVVRDISERQRNEEDLRLRDRIIHASAIGVVIADARQPDNPVVYVNPAFERITGYSADEVIGSNCRLLQGPDTDPKALGRIRAALEAETDVTALLRNYTKQGQVFWNDLYITPIRDTQGHVSHFVGLQNDVTARVIAQNELAANEAFMRRVLNSTRDAIIVITPDGVVESFNKGAEDMFGYGAAEVIGRNVSMLVPSPHQARHDDYIRRYLGTGVSHVLGQAREFEAVRKDGSLFPMVLRINEMREGGEHHFLGVIHDITERKQVENEVRAALREKEILLKEIHHRVKNNLLVVSSILAMQQDGTQEPEMRRILQEGQDRIHSMALIHEKLYRSKNLDQVDFSGYLEQLVERLSSTYQAPGGRVRVHLDLAPVSLNIDTATPCGLIVNELLANCFEHAFPDGRAGDLWLTLAEQDGQIILTLRDNGVGMPANLDTQNTESLGMQLVTLLTQQIGGRLEVLRNAGTTFRLEFRELHYTRRI